MASLAVSTENIQICLITQCNKYMVLLVLPPRLTRSTNHTNSKKGEKTMKNTTAGLALALLLAWSLTACGERSPDEYIVAANEFIANSEYDAAIIELKNALQSDSQLAEARWLLGKIYLDSGDVLSAEKELKRALDAGWSIDEVTPALAQSWLAQRKFSEISALDTDPLKPASKADLLSSQALASLALGENQRARKLIDRALETQSDSVPALLAQARMLASQGDFPGAELALATLTSLDAENAQAWHLIGDIRVEQRKPDEAREAYGKAIALAEGNYSALFRRALVALQAEDYEAAQLDAHELIRIAPNQPSAGYVQGLIHFQAGRFKEAVTSLSVAEPAFTRFPMILFYLASAQFAEGNLDQASVQATRYYGIAPDSINSRKLLSTIRLQQGKFDEVIDLLEPLLAANPDDVSALNLMANALLGTGETGEGIKLLSRVTELQPDSSAAQVRLGAGLLMGGDSDDATQHIEAALKLDPEFQQADILLVVNHLQKKDYPAAIEAAEDYRLRNLTSTPPLNLLGQVYLAAGQFSEAKKSFEKALTFDQGDPTANHQLAQMAVSEKDLAAARAHYKALLKNREDHLPTLIQLAILDAQEGDKVAMVEHLEQAIKAHPQAIEPRIFLGRFHLSQKRPEKVAPLFSSLEKAQKQSPQVLQLMAMAQLSNQEHGDAQFTLEQLMGSAPNTAELHHMMAMAASGTGDMKRVEQELNNALALDNDYLPAAIALAKLTLNRKRTEEFQEHLRHLKLLAPKNIDVLLLSAAGESLNGNNLTAIALAEQAFEQKSTTATLLSLGAYLGEENRSDDALALYEKWLKENPDDVPVRMAVGNSMQATQQLDEAVDAFEDILRLDPNNVVALNNLAWSIRNIDPAKALDYALRSSALAPESPEVLDTLAVVEYANNEYKKAQRTIQKALSKRPDNPSILYHSAMIAAVMGDEAKAVLTLQKLTSGNIDFPEKDDAIALLMKLKK
ncbi:MAG: putative PEP-CTERM system TPR-repeat lipoprotein [Halioglobus sp.]|jgi:putative PEP-CTERM system TPR-repeat lipoprotein